MGILQPALCAVLTVSGLAGAATPEHIPLRNGLMLVSALQSPDGDRENVVTVQGTAQDGITYTWHGSQPGPGGKRTDAMFSRFVSAADLAGATRLNTVFRMNDQADYPGYTAFSFSTRVYQELRSTGTVAFTITALGEGLLPGLGTNAKYKGTLSLVAPQSEPFPLIVNGVAATVPSLHIHGRFAFREQPLEQDFWVLEDSAHALILKTVTGHDVLQLLRVEMPADAVVPAAVTVVERELDQQCRAELPGVYFAFGTAVLDQASNATLGSVAGILKRHPQWTLSIEGHTDNIGANAANQRLSEQRARAVQMSLSAAYSIAPERLQSAGFGASRPRATNDTMAGRARNRRVELVRPCEPKSSGGQS
ncbi:MAG TPA: OmpA family protein [Steroidobacteraceae bacterium]|nr:OmpA family protein [Steroidobacteraceae bacterium]